MEYYTDYKIGDRVGRFYDDKIEKATIIEINNGLYTVHFDNEDYLDLVCDAEKIFLLEGIDE